MSHIEDVRTNLALTDLLPAIQQGDLPTIAQHQSIRLLAQAVSLVAKQYNGTVKPHYYSFSGEEQPTNTGLAIHIPRSAQHSSDHALPRGLGLDLDRQTGTLIFRGDLWGVEPTFAQQIQQHIIRTHVALIHAAAMRLMRYQVATQEASTQHINIIGDTYVA